MKISADMISTLSRNSSAPEKTTSEDAFRKFETMLIAEVLKTGQKPIGGSHPLDGGSAGSLYREQFAEAVAAEMSEAGGIGIARQLLEQQRLRSGATDE